MSESNVAPILILDENAEEKELGRSMVFLLDVLDRSLSITFYCGDLDGYTTSLTLWRTEFIVIHRQIPTDPDDQQECAGAPHREVLLQREQQGPAFPYRKAYRSPIQSDPRP